MKGRLLVIVGTLMYVVAWFLPVEKNLPDLAQGVLPGWAAFRIAVWPYDGGTDPWYSWLHYMASALSNFVLLGALIVVYLARRRPRGWLAVLLAACALLNTHWFIINSDRQDLRVGYYLWAGSFFVISAGLALKRRESVVTA